MILLDVLCMHNIRSLNAKIVAAAVVIISTSKFLCVTNKSVEGNNNAIGLMVYVTMDESYRICICLHNSFHLSLFSCNCLNILFSTAKKSIFQFHLFDD